MKTMWAPWRIEYILGAKDKRLRVLQRPFRAAIELTLYKGRQHHGGHEQVPLHQRPPAGGARAARVGPATSSARRRWGRCCRPSSSPSRF
ncbi:MAG: hypothetical protein MZV70_29025 [Desulfobacterales bacterium]|nr:hypothetical protein [Desulfobacterales bacterium]